MKINRLLTAIYPTIGCCALCCNEIFDDDLLICDKCKIRLPYILGTKCLHCSEPIPSGKYCLRCKGLKFECDKIISPFSYDDIIKSMVLGLKYHDKKQHAYMLGRYMAMCFVDEMLPCDYITCVPLCAKRFKERGYNQAELIAEVFASYLNMPLCKDMLIRVKETITQTELNGEERRANMKGAFKVVNKEDVKDKIIVIVDDVYTTGATVNECAVALKSAGAKAVYAVTASHTISLRGNLSLEAQEENVD